MGVCSLKRFRPDHPKRGYHRYERQTVSKETAGEAKQPERHACQRRPNYARELKLRRVHRDRIREIFAANQVVSHRQKRRTRERHATAGDEREAEHHPAIDEVRCHQHSQRHRRHTGNHLRVKQQPAPIDQIRKDATDEGEHKPGRGRDERIETQPERGVGQQQHQPALRDCLHPRTNV